MRQFSLYPCRPWPIEPSCCPDWPADEADWTDAHREAQTVATIYLWRAVAGAVGLCDAAVRPCMDACRNLPDYSSSLGGWTYPYIASGRWYNASGCGCGNDVDCACGTVCTVTLPGPVHEIVRVNDGGDVLEPDDYRLLSDETLARVDGHCWPSCQDLGATQGQRGNFTVSYVRGIQPGPDAIRAVSALACRLLKECVDGGADGCGQLPDNVTSLTREGISMRFGGEDGFDRPSVLAIPQVSRFVASVNPYAITAQASVWTPDLPWRQDYTQGAVL